MRTHGIFWRAPTFLGLVVAAALVHVTPVAGQQGGAIVGRIVAEGGGPIAGATVQLLQRARTLRQMPTNDDGRYLFVGLPEGEYTVRVETVGYRVERELVRLDAGERRTLDLVVAPEPVALGAVEVIVPPVRIERESTEFGTELTATQIQLLPTPKSASELVAYTAGARAGHVWGGATAQANNYRIDGLFANHPGVGGELIEPSIRWIDRVEVIGLGAGAEHGEFQGGIVSVTTKAGSNEFTGALYTDVESEALNSSNIGPGEIGSEVEQRYEVEGELSGPIVRDKLFFFAAGSYSDGDRRFANHLRGIEDRFAPPRETRAEWKAFGKLSFQPLPTDLFEVTAGRIDTRIDNFGSIGYEAAPATLELTAPTTFTSASWKHSWDWGVLDVRGASFLRDEKRWPYNGIDRPGLWAYGTVPPYESFGNAPIRYRQRAESYTGAATLSLEGRTGPLRHRLKLGAELTRGGWLNERKRNGGVTWRPVMTSKFDPETPSSWSFRAGDRTFLPVVFGGEVHLDADVENGALFIQDYIDIGGRVTLSPGVRVGRWQGWLTPRDGSARFLAVGDEAIDPRIGITWDVTGSSDFVLKGHWGRYHQSMFAQFFDRIEGGDVYSDQELYDYFNPDIPTLDAVITEAEKEALVASGQLELRERIRLNQSGPVDGYRQPYIDQWLLGAEKMLGENWKIEGLYVNRANRDMVGLVDRNIEDNYAAFDFARVFQRGSSTPLDYRGLPLVLDRVYIDHETLYEFLRVARLNDWPIPPGFTSADTTWLRDAWNPDYVLTTIPEARRQFHQYQLSVEGSYATWGASASIVVTDLKGNFDTVTGYEDRTAYDEPFLYSAGPYVNPNEATNYFGKLPNHSTRELKLALFGELAFDVQGGAYWNWATGDHYTPYFVLSTLSWAYESDGRQLDGMLFWNTAGQRIFVEERGARQIERRASLDLRMERTFEIGDGLEWVLTADILNALNFNTISDVNPMVNYGKRYNPQFRPRGEDPQKFFEAVRERHRPRAIRIGTSVRF